MPPQTKPSDNNPPSDAKVDFSEIAVKVAEKINSADNILVALSKDPSIDEISAALATTMILDSIGKHVTAIYSGTTPNILAFLKPEETFEKDTNSLQDFIIALNKNKADHLRYNIEGEYVRVYITPYRTDLSEKDLEFSRGDFNVDLVITFDVRSGSDLDGALTEYGRIMHDATAVNISTEHSGRFAELEWFEPKASSVCELITVLVDQLKINELSPEIATALLTGIVAATDRFSNQRTSSDVMAIASRLMAAGADQQLISAKILDQTQSENSDSPEPQPESKPESNPDPIPEPTPAPALEPTPASKPTPAPALESTPDLAALPTPGPITPTIPEPIQPAPTPNQNQAPILSPEFAPDQDSFTPSAPPPPYSTNIKPGENPAASITPNISNTQDISSIPNLTYDYPTQLQPQMQAEFQPQPQPQSQAFQSQPQLQPVQPQPIPPQPASPQYPVTPQPTSQPTPAPLSTPEQTPAPTPASTPEQIPNLPMPDAFTLPPEFTPPPIDFNPSSLAMPPATPDVPPVTPEAPITPPPASPSPVPASPTPSSDAAMLSDAALLSDAPMLSGAPDPNQIVQPTTTQSPNTINSNPNPILPDSANQPQSPDANSFQIPTQF